MCTTYLSVFFKNAGKIHKVVILQAYTFKLYTMGVSIDNDSTLNLTFSGLVKLQYLVLTGLQRNGGGGLGPCQ